MNAVVCMLTCRNCGGELVPLAEGQSDGAVGFLPMKCSKCRKSYTMRVDVIECPGEPKLGRVEDGRTRRYENGSTRFVGVS